jgi:ceramide glucosyltransferase
MLALMPLGWLAGALSLIGCLYMVAATVLTARFLRGRTPAVPPPAPVSVIKPLHGAYPGMLEVLQGYCDQDFGAAVQIVFGVRDPADPAVAVVAALRARRPHTDIELVIDPAQHGANRKVSNLINIAARARHPILVLSDADIGVAPDYLRQVTSALAGRGVGAVSCLYVGEDDGSPWSRLGAMAINNGFLPNAVLGLTLGLARPCFGSTIALTTETLAQIGGLQAFADHLADDYEIGRAVRARGLAIAVPRMVVSHRCIEATGADLIGHELRWGRTVRQLEPAGYLGSLITHPLPLALVAGALIGAPLPALTLILTALGVRIACKFAMDAVTGSPAGHWWLIPARDVLSFGVFVASFTVNTVGWQGGRFRVGRGGVLSHT